MFQAFHSSVFADLSLDKYTQIGGWIFFFKVSFACLSLFTSTCCVFLKSALSVSVLCLHPVVPLLCVVWHGSVSLLCGVICPLAFLFLHATSVLLMLSVYPSRKKWDLDLSSSPCLVNPGWLLPSCSNPKSILSSLCVCESVCGGCWWDVEGRFQRLSV